MRKTNTHFEKRIKDLVQVRSLRKAVKLLLRATEIYNPNFEDENLNEHNKSCCVILGELSDLRNKEIRDDTNQDVLTKNFNSLSKRIISLSEDISQKVSQKISLENIDEEKSKSNFFRNLISTILILSAITAVIFYQKINQNNIEINQNNIETNQNNIGVVLVGSGTVYNHLIRKYKEIFNMDNLLRVTPLECPSGIGIDVITNSYQRGEPKNMENMDSLPGVIGLSSKMLYDTSFSKRIVEQNKKYYGIQIGNDEIKATIGGNWTHIKETPSIKRFFDDNKKPIDKMFSISELRELIKTKSKGDFLVFATNRKSGTFASWEEKLNMVDSLESYIEDREFDTSQKTKAYLSGKDVKKPWIVLCSEDYKIENFNDLTQNSNEPIFEHFKVSNSLGIPLKRPLILYGKLNSRDADTFQRNGVATKVYELDKSVCKFWENFIELMKEKNEFDKYIEGLKDEMLLFGLDGKNCRCGIKDRANEERLIMYEIDE